MSPRPCRILYVDDEPAYGRLFCRGLYDDRRFRIETAVNGEEALRKLRQQPADIVLTDLLMPRMDGLCLLEAIRQEFPDTFVLLLTAVDSADKAVRAIKAGAYDYILKPLDMTMIRRQLEKILEHRRLLENSGQTTAGEFRFENLIGRDPAMYEIFDKIRQIAQTDSTVLIHGESGTGKELIAEAIHARSARKGKPFVGVNCAALPESLISSALFGHEKGAFSGALARAAGFFEAASGGTIFLDEIGDIPVQTQVALLRVLELGSFQRVGGTETIQVDTRVICATNKNLATAIKEKTFREDLYYRINVVSLSAPPLRERKSDIPLLARFFLDKFSSKIGRRITAIDPAALNLLCNYSWPGNVRELSNMMERAVVFCQDETVCRKHLPSEILTTLQSDFSLTLHDSSLANAEASLIRKVLEEKNWHLSQAASALGIARGTLYSKMEKLGIHKPAGN